MPSDDYALTSGGGGALKLKGGKVDKKKKKKKRAKTHLEKNLTTSDDAASSRELVTNKKDAREDAEDRIDEDERDGESTAQKTESERQYEETKKKRVSYLTSALAFAPPPKHVLWAVDVLINAVTQNGGKVGLPF